MGSPTLTQRFNTLFKKQKNELEYQPVHTEFSGGYDENDVRRPVLVVPDDESFPDEELFSWLEYSVFLLLGIAMLWAWNMFLSAAPYFQSRFVENKAILARFQSAITSISCVTSLASTITLTKLQSNANYPRRIRVGLIVFFLVFALLSISTTQFQGVSTEVYFVFTLIMVFFTSIGTGLCQNGSFAFAASIGRPEYIQAIVAGQGIAGVLPSIAQIVSVLAITNTQESTTVAEKSNAITKESSAALSYFITATVVSVVTSIAIIPILRRHKRDVSYDLMNPFTNPEEPQASKRKCDIFYLIVVCFGFGLTNGMLNSLCMMNAGKYVTVEEREATGGFMVVNLLAGLTVGSLLSFAVSGA
ncbi:hypothetical protein EPUL_005831, partial [Erysiphe pulchra]